MLSVCRSSGAKYNRLWYLALAFVTLMLFTAAVGAVVFMGVFYTHPDACLLNKVFLGINGSLCLIVSLLAISPCIQKREDLYSQAHYLIILCNTDGNTSEYEVSRYSHINKSLTESLSLQYNPHQACCSQGSSVCTSCISPSPPSPANQRKVSMIIISWPPWFQGEC